VAPAATARQAKSATPNSTTAARAAKAAQTARGRPARKRACGFACATASSSARVKARYSTARSSASIMLRQDRDENAKLLPSSRRSRVRNAVRAKLRGS
jgi:hypothetical protein